MVETRGLGGKGKKEWDPPTTAIRLDGSPGTLWYAWIPFPGGYGVILEGIGVSPAYHLFDAIKDRICASRYCEQSRSTLLKWRRGGRKHAPPRRPLCGLNAPALHRCMPSAPSSSHTHTHIPTPHSGNLGLPLCLLRNLHLLHPEPLRVWCANGRECGRRHRSHLAGTFRFPAYFHSSCACFHVSSSHPLVCTPSLPPSSLSPLHYLAHWLPAHAPRHGHWPSRLLLLPP